MAFNNPSINNFDQRLVPNIKLSNRPSFDYEKFNNPCLPNGEKPNFGHGSNTQKKHHHPKGQRSQTAFQSFNHTSNHNQHQHQNLSLNKTQIQNQFEPQNSCLAYDQAQNKNTQTLAHIANPNKNQYEKPNENQAYNIENRNRDMKTFILNTFQAASASASASTSRSTTPVTPVAATASASASASAIATINNTNSAETAQTQPLIQKSKNQTSSHKRSPSKQTNKSKSSTKTFKNKSPLSSPKMLQRAPIINRGSNYHLETCPDSRPLTATTATTATTLSALSTPSTESTASSVSAAKSLLFSSVRSAPNSSKATKVSSSCYAGNSFHHSPETKSLPKPSFM